MTKSESRDLAYSVRHHLVSAGFINTSVSLRDVSGEKLHSHTRTIGRIDLFFEIVKMGAEILDGEKFMSGSGKEVCFPPCFVVKATKSEWYFIQPAVSDDKSLFMSLFKQEYRLSENFKIEEISRGDWVAVESPKRVKKRYGDLIAAPVVRAMPKTIRLSAEHVWTVAGGRRPHLVEDEFRTETFTVKKSQIKAAVSPADCMNDRVKSQGLCRERKSKNNNAHGNKEKPESEPEAIPLIKCAICGSIGTFDRHLTDDEFYVCDQCAPVPSFVGVLEKIHAKKGDRVLFFYGGEVQPGTIRNVLPASVRIMFRDGVVRKIHLDHILCCISKRYKKGKPESWLPSVGTKVLWQDERGGKFEHMIKHVRGSNGRCIVLDVREDKSFPGRTKMRIRQDQIIVAL